MVREKRILSYFIVWLIMGITICFVGVSNVFADTIDQSITFATEVNQEFYSGGGDEWITCTNYTCPLWTSPTKSGTITWIAYKFYTELKANTTYYLELTTTFDYKNNSNTNIPVWKFSNYYGSGDTYKPNIHYMNYCNLVDSESTSNKDIYKWKCSMTPTTNASEFQFYFWTNQNYNALSQNGIFMAGNTSTITLSSLKFSYLDNTTGALITQNEIIINQNNQTNEKLDDIKDSLTNDDVDNSINNAGSFFDNFDTTDHGGLSGIITAPLIAINQMLNTSCNPMTTTFKGKELSLPCGYDFWNKMGPIQDFVNLVLGGLLCYQIIIKLYKLIEKLKNPEDDRVEVMNL